MTDLMNASRQWAKRPADERFESTKALLAHTEDRRVRAAEAETLAGDLRVGTNGESLALIGPSGKPAYLNAWSFEQLCRRAGAPADYLAGLPAANVTSDLNHTLAKGNGTKTTLLFERQGADLANPDRLMLRAITSDKYARLWDFQIAQRLDALTADGWRVPPARPAFDGQPGSRQATEADVLEDQEQGGGLSTKVGDWIAPAGLYCGDRDLFAFMVNEKFRIDDGTDAGMSRGFFVENSEVWGRSFKLTTFLYRHVCGNHIVWDADKINRIRIAHVGDAPEQALAVLKVRVTEYAQRSAEDDRLRVVRTQQHVLGAKKDEVIDQLFKAAILPRKTLIAAWDDAEESNENPTTAWGFAQGITHLSQQSPYASRRADLDLAASKVLQIAF
jgi:uncharacterized protein DUF932